MRYDRPCETTPEVFMGLTINWRKTDGLREKFQGKNQPSCSQKILTLSFLSRPDRLVKNPARKPSRRATARRTPFAARGRESPRHRTQFSSGCAILAAHPLRRHQ